MSLDRGNTRVSWRVGSKGLPGSSIGVPSPLAARASPVPGATSSSLAAARPATVSVRLTSSFAPGRFSRRFASASASISADPAGTQSVRYTTSEDPSGPDQAARGVPGTIQVVLLCACHDFSGESVMPARSRGVFGLQPGINPRNATSNALRSTLTHGTCGTIE